MEHQTIQLNGKSKKPATLYNAEEKSQIIERWKQSGLSRLSFCRQYNLSYYSLSYWIKKKRSRGKVISSGFIPIQVKSSTDQIFAQIETNGKRIQLYQPVTAYFLKQLLG